MASKVMQYVTRYWECSECSRLWRYSHAEVGELQAASEQYVSCGNGHRVADCFLREDMTEHYTYALSAA